ncbi:MAG: hypothetical protein Q7S52_04415 [bacterium]|nr:hypothetical protein [bacterium]
MKTHFQEFLRSALFTKVMWGLGVLLVLSMVFHVGIFVGFHKAKFAGYFGEHYYQGFEGKDRRHSFGMPMRGLPEAHGTTGKIIEVAFPGMVVLGDDGVEKTVRISDRTEIRRFRDRASVEDISVGDSTVVLGTPNENGEIDARFIRLLPAATLPVVK